ncbi:MAG: fructose-1,6-bisphosphatase [Lachnospiraceae bacterium]|nr:fructose-1,6-bisphosphatase [Lachnospiraceae bacterium]
MDEQYLKYLKLLAKQYPTIAKASTEIINLASILNLPKATEHFLTDIHGEYEQFLHILKNGSGSVRRKIEEEFANTISQRDKRSLATLIYYPEEKMELILKEEENLDDWYKITLYRLIQISKHVTSKYTRSKVKKALPSDFAYIIEELIQEKEEVHDKDAYYNQIILAIIRTGRAKECIIAFCYLIQRLVVDHLHIVGDIFDRGPGAHIIMDTLMNYHSVDIQWGNHDIEWMGAAAGNLACIANVIRISARYGNLDTLEEGYGINLIPLATFAMNVYAEDPCSCFDIHYNKDIYNIHDLELDRKMHKAISIIQFKLEGQLIQRRPEFGMESRLLLDKIQFETGTIQIDGKEYHLEDSYFPTVDPKDPYRLTEEEVTVVERLKSAFLQCEKLQKHVRFLFSKGSLYLTYNSNLLYHGCIPLGKDGTFRKVKIKGKEYSGKGLYDVMESWARKGYYREEGPEKEFGKDIMWYIWSNENSPVYGKTKMATFERYFIKDKEVQSEKKNYYYQLIEKEEVVNQIFKEFGLDAEHSHIINGHMPVELKKGETPIKCGGKVLIIDGGLSKAYQSKTGIAGYTLIYNSYGLRLVSHEPFESKEMAIAKESDIHSETMVVERVSRRRSVADTDAGKEIEESIIDLSNLLSAYRDGTIREKEQ